MNPLYTASIIIDAGKSTLIGNLLTLSGQFDTKTHSKTIKEEIPLAWITDESPSEREHGVTIDIAER